MNGISALIRSGHRGSMSACFLPYEGTKRSQVSAIQKGALTRT